MKKRTQEKVAKVFALVVVLIMVFQVLMPLFDSATLNKKDADINTSTQKVEEVTQPAVETDSAKSTDTAKPTTATTESSLTISEPAPVSTDKK